MKTFLLATATLAIVTTFAISAEPDYDKMKKTWNVAAKEDTEKKEKTRQENLALKIEDLSGKVKDLKAAVKKLNDPVGKKKAQIAEDKRKAKELETVITSREKQIKSLQLAKANPIPESYGLDMRLLKDGDFGKVGANGNSSEPPVFKVLQIQDKNNALMTWGEATYWVELNTKGMTDDDKVEIKDFVHCLGTKSYQSNAGKRTVMHLKIVK